MLPIGTKTLAEFTVRAKGICKIQNMQITHTEIDLLIEGHWKLDPTIINMVSARLQQITGVGRCPKLLCLFVMVGATCSRDCGGRKMCREILEHVQAAVYEHLNGLTFMDDSQLHGHTLVEYFFMPQTQAVISKTAPALKICIPLKKFAQSVKKTGGKRN